MAKTVLARKKSSDDEEWHPPLLAGAKPAPQLSFQETVAKALAAKQGGTQVAPPGARDAGVVTPRTGGSTGGGAAGGSFEASAAATAESNAKRAGKDQSRKQNQATQSIIDALLSSLDGYTKGRDTLVQNADSALNNSLEGILNSLRLADQDYAESGSANEQDQAAKTSANVTNRARERTALLSQAASQGAGETDQLRAQIQAYLNSDANQQEVERSFFDTERSINSQIAGAASQAETSRRSAWAQNQESKSNAWNEFWKNTGDVWTNIQRTGAQNTNVDSDYSEAFNADYRGNDPVQRAAENAGRAYSAEKKDDEFFKQDRPLGRKKKTTASERAGATTIKAPRAAEGATLRGRW